MKMDKIINFILYLLIIFLIIYMLYIVYKCKKSDNQILIEKYYNFYNNKYENFVDYNSEKYTQKQNECIKNWINNSNGMKTYLESLKFIYLLLSIFVALLSYVSVSIFTKAFKLSDIHLRYK